MVGTGIVQQFGGLIVGCAVFGMAALGYRHGLFLATLAGLNVLVSLIVALGLSASFAGLVASFGCPDAYALPIAFGLLLAGCVVGIRLLVGAALAEDSVRLSPLVDAIGGAAVGIVAGMAAAGAVLVALSFAPLPDEYRIDGTRLQFDFGTKMLDTFAACVAPGEKRRRILVHGEATAPRPEQPECSEPFVDRNRNGVFDDGERFVDVDGNQKFTPRLGFTDHDENGARDLGLRERYALGVWGGQANLLYPPVSTSPAAVRRDRPPQADEPIYQATATDIDHPAGLVFSLENAAEAGLTIDSQTGEVKLAPDGPKNRRPPLSFTVLVTDPSGLSARQEVTVRW
jgi:hypothetical protein